MDITPTMTPGAIPEAVEERQRRLAREAEMIAGTPPDPWKTFGRASMFHAQQRDELQAQAAEERAGWVPFVQA